MATGIELNDAELELFPVRVLEHEAPATRQGESDAVFYSSILGREARLVEMGTDALQPHNAPEFVNADVAALQAISNAGVRRSAMVAIASNIKSQVQYSRLLLAQSPGLFAELQAHVEREQRHILAVLNAPQSQAAPQPGFCRLVRCGAAPYLHDSKNAGSYFAELQDAQGLVQTLWGVDIDRSLTEAGVQPGDLISLTKNGHRMVEINERQSDGSYLMKTVPRVNWETVRQPLAQKPVGASQGKAAVPDGDAAHSVEPPVAETRFAVMASYWIDGLHNFEGVALARELNKVVKAKNLAEDQAAIASLLAIQIKAHKLGLQVVGESRYLHDANLKLNPAEPTFLSAGAFVRDKEGAYRPAAGGLAVMVDKGDCLALHSKSTQSCRAAMELAVAKGWTTIELKGKPAVLAEAWLEARLQGLNVANYQPTEKDMARYQERVVEESRQRANDRQSVSEQDSPETLVVRPLVDSQGTDSLDVSETVLVRPVVDSQGVTRDASVTSATSSAEGSAGESPATSEAASIAEALPNSSVICTSTRMDGVVRDSLVFDQVPSVPNANARSSRVDQEFNDAMMAVGERTSANAAIDVAAGLPVGPSVGVVMQVRDGRLGQKIGRDPGQLVWHELSNLDGKIPEVGELAEIVYASGRGVVRAPHTEHEVGQADIGAAR